MKQRLIGADTFAIDHLPVHRHARVQLTKDRIDPGRAGDHCRIARDDGGLGQPFCRNQLGGDIAAANILKQCATHIGFNLGAQVGNS